MKAAHYTVHATAEQSTKWNRAAEAEGFRSVGGWIALAVDAYLKARARAGAPVPLAWHRRRFSVLLEGGERATVNGHVSPPFGVYAGTEEGPAAYAGRRRFVLVHLPTSRVVATLRSFARCKLLATEIAPVLIRGDPFDPGGVVERYRREEV